MKNKSKWKTIKKPTLGCLLLILGLILTACSGNKEVQLESYVAAEVQIQDLPEETTPAPLYYTVTYDANGHGSAPIPAIVEENAAVTFPGELSEEGYRFLGWSVDGVAAYNFEIPVTGDITLYALWEEVQTEPETEAVTEPETTTAYYDTLQVIFDANGGQSTFKVQYYTIGDEGKTFEGTISRSGYEFLGWSFDKNAESGIYSVNNPVADGWIESTANANSGTVILYAIWGQLEKSNEEIAMEIINGLWGNGQERYDALRDAGYDPAVIQSLVDQMVR